MQLKALGACALLAACQPSVPQAHPAPGEAPAGTASGRYGPSSEARSVNPDAGTETTVQRLDEAEPQEALRRFEQELHTPLVSRDGKLVALSNRFVRVDGPPSMTPHMRRNHVIAIVDVALDKATSRVATPPSLTDAEAVRTALAQARALLAKHEWEPLTALTMGADTQWPARVHGLGTTMPQWGRGEGLTVQFHEPNLRLIGPKGQQLFEAKLLAWSNTPTSGQGCLIYTDLLQAWVSRRHRVLAVELAFSASPHHCDFAPALHVIRFPAPPTGKTKTPAGGTGT
jgi:hypothetical protein